MTTTTIKTASSTTMRVIQRGKFSAASAVLLLCAALLLTKSSTVLALSGDGNLDAWSETTTVGEGSGWEVTIISTGQPDYTTERKELTTEANDEVDTTTINAELPTEGGEEVESTVSPNEPEPETTAQPNEQQSSSSPNGVQSTASPSDLPASQGPSEGQTSPSPSEQASTSAPNQEQPTTSDPNPSEEQPTTTEAEPVISTIAPTPPAPPVFECPAVGLYPHISGDCQRFHNCLLDTLSGELRALEMQCPPTTTFSPSHGRCLRDLAECANDAFVCPSHGRFPGSDNTHYYICVARVRGGFHKYLVRCSVGQRYEPLLRRCWRFDWTQVLPGQPLEAIDLAAIKREQKELKAEEKQRKKAEKNLEKEARKQQKLEEKLAKKAAKEQAKKEAKANKPVSVESAESLEQSSFGN